MDMDVKSSLAGYAAHTPGVPAASRSRCASGLPLNRALVAEALLPRPLVPHCAAAWSPLPPAARCSRRFCLLSQRVVLWKVAARALPRRACLVKAVEALQRAAKAKRRVGSELAICGRCRQARSMPQQQAMDGNGIVV